MFSRFADGQAQETVFTEDEKLSEKYLKAEIDATINSISSISKAEVEAAYRVRNGERDINDFSYLWAAYGIQFPAQLRHIPVLRVVFDSLVGQYQNRPFKWQVSSSDSDSVNCMFDQFRDDIMADVERYYVNRIRAFQLGAEQGGTEGERARQHLEKLKKKYESGTFQSDLEIDAKNMITWAIQRFNLKSILEEMVNHYATSGRAYYQTKVLRVGEKPLIRAINPINLYYHKPLNVRFIKDCDRVVYRERMSVVRIWHEYGHMMTSDQQKKFVQDYGQYILSEDLEIIGADNAIVEPERMRDTDSSMTVQELNVDYVEFKSNVRVPMTEVEENIESGPHDKIREQKQRYKYRMDLFEGIRIGNDIHVAMGRNKLVTRDPDNPSYVSLTINGTCYNDINGKPYALALKVKDIGDKIDILHYHAENLLALSGSKAVMVDYPGIPAWIEGTPTQRVMKWLGFLKQGVGLVDSSQENAGNFQQGGPVDLSLSNTLEQIYRMAQILEDTAYRITGTNRQVLGNISQSDGKGTTELAIQGSAVVTQSFFSSFDHLAEQFMTDVANACRIAYGKGLVGNILLGEVGQRLFSIKSKQFPLAFLNVHISNSGDIERDLDSVRAVAQELITAGMLQADVAVDMVTLKSLTEIKKRIKESLESGDAQQKQQADDQIKQYEDQVKKLTAQVEQMTQSQDAAKQAEVQGKMQISAAEQDRKDRELAHKVGVDNEQLKLDARRVDLEAQQLAYSPGAREVKNS